MIYIERLLKPKILQNKEKEWKQKFLASDKNRPDSSKYRHKEILETLSSMSFKKCFYCEQKLSVTPNEIDHYIEVSEDRNLAYNWDNLYLSCRSCNNKLTNKAIPVKITLNPCVDSDEEISKHIYFKDEFVKNKPDSVKGLKTIQKYKLDNDTLDHLRLKQLSYFSKLIEKISFTMIKEKRKKLTNDEKLLLISFKEKNHSFSLMFKYILKKYENLLTETI